MLSTNAIDIIILIIFLYAIVIGFVRGFVSEILSLITLVAAIIIASKFAVPLANMFTNSNTVQGVAGDTSSALGMNTSQSISYIALGLSFAVIFFATIICGSLIKMMVNSVMAVGMLSVGNRILGAVFGVLKGYVLNIIFIFILQLTPVTGSAVWQTSQYLPYFQSAVTWVNEITAPALGTLKAKLGSGMQSVSTQLQGLAQ